MNDLNSTIKELAFLYIKVNYEKYLKENNLTEIQYDKLKSVVDSIYTEEKKKNMKTYIKQCLKKMYEETTSKYPGDLIVNTILNEIDDDDELCKNRLIAEINLYQQKKKQNYNNLI